MFGGEVVDEFQKGVHLGLLSSHMLVAVVIFERPA